MQKLDFKSPVDVETPTIPLKSLPDILETKVIREKLEVPKYQCCSFGVCGDCESSNRYPVLFLHGHSFAETSFPEYNIQAFTKMAKSLEAHSIITPGTYEGRWTAYYVEVLFENGRKSGKIKLDGGVRGFNIECKVLVDDDGYLHVK